MPDWNITGGNFSGGTLAAEGVNKCRYTLQAGGMDKLNFWVPGAADGTPPVDVSDAVTLAYNSGTVFRGFVAAMIPQASGGAEGFAVEVLGDMHKLARTPFLQRVAVTDTPATYAYTTRAVLGFNNSGTRLNLAQTLEDIIDSTVARHGLTSGLMLDGYSQDVPIMEVTDMTVLEAMQRCLVWSPDAVLWYDHAANSVLVTKLANMVNVNVASADLSGISTDQKKRFPVEGVLILWETIDVVDGEEYRTIEEDSAGTTTGMDVAVVTIPLRGKDLVIQEQECMVDAIPRGNLDFTAANLKTWLGEHFPELKTWADGAHTSALSLVSLRQTVNAAAKTGLGTIPTYTDAGTPLGDAYPSQIIGGAVPPWQSGISAAPVDISIILKPGADFDSEVSLWNFFPGDEKIRELRLRVTGTDAASITYRKTVDNGMNEEPVPGLASAWLTALNAAAPACTLTIPGAEAVANIYPGKKLTVTGAFALGPAVVQAVTVDVDAGTSTVTCGPLNRLTPPDYVELLRSGSRRSPVTNGSGDSRTDSAVKGQTVATVAAARVQDTHTPPPPIAIGYFAPRLKKPGEVTIAEGLVVWEEFQGVGPLGTATIRGRNTGVAEQDFTFVAADDGHYIYATVTRVRVFTSEYLFPSAAYAFHSSEHYWTFDSVTINKAATVPEPAATNQTHWPLARWWKAVGDGGERVQPLHNGAALYCPPIGLSYVTPGAPS